MARYASAAEVKSFMQLPAAFGAGTNPTQTEVEAFLDYNTQNIDTETMHNFDGTAVATEEFHLKHPQYDSRDGFSIFLSNRVVQTLTAGSGDVLTIWNGSTDEDYLANKVESRTGDFWLDYNMGVLHIRTFRWSRPRYFSVNITYRYGEASLPNDIKKACILLTAADIVGSDDRSVLLPEGTDNIQLIDKAQRWRQEASRIIKSRREIKVASGL